MNEPNSICFHPIGVVRNSFDRPADKDLIAAEVSELEIHPQFRPGLAGAAPGQKILVLFYFHLAEGEAPLQQHPRGDQTRPRRGVFLLRSPARPNQIGATEVTVEEVREGGLTVRGLDALNGSPILDLKIVSGEVVQAGPDA
jgi:L-fuculose-phosphate aldolase